jgi:glucosamine--fructose-6-phosphate aminotransferase (isomerizing)
MGQITALYLLAIYIGRLRGTLSVEQERELIDELIQLPYKIETALDREPAVEELASRFINSENFLFLGRGMSYPIAMEGALKLKEISYVHAEAYAAGEMKHATFRSLSPGGLWF